MDDTIRATDRDEPRHVANVTSRSAMPVRSERSSGAV